MFNNLNSIPQKTFSFLKINSLSLGDVLVPEFVTTPLNLPKENFNNKIEEFNDTIYNKHTNSILSENDFEEIKNNFNSGFYVEIKESLNKGELIYIDLLFSHKSPSLIANNKIVIKKGCTANIVLNIDSLDASYGFYYSNTEIVLEENASLNLSRIQSLNNTSINIEGFSSNLAKSSNLNFTSIDIGGYKNVLNFQKDLFEESNANLNQIYLGKDEKLIDINKRINFHGSCSYGNMNTKGLLLDSAKKNLRFTLDFKKGSKKAVGNEDEYVMILSPKVKNLSAPLLLAGENDVKGNHACSVGKINESSLFYLMSRGLSEEEAKVLIIKGAFSSIIETLPTDDLKTKLYSEVERRLQDDKGL